MSAFALGAFAFGALALLGAIAVAALADASGRPSFELQLAGLEFVAFVRDGQSTSTALGPGLGVLAVAGGLLNVAGAAALTRLGAGRR